MVLDPPPLSSRDRLPLALFASLGGLLAWWIVHQLGSVFFYQMFMPEALMWACGRGFRHPLVLPSGMMDFLFHRSIPSFTCASIPADLPTGPPGFFFHMQLYLSWAAAALWRLLGPTQLATAPLAALLEAGYAAGAYLLARLFLSRFLSIIAALALILSPVALGQIFSLRDFSKGPFFLWGISLLVLAAREVAPRRALVWALLAGIIVGVGYGFRADLAILALLGTGFLVLAPRFALPARAGLAATYVGGFLLLASPILILGNGGNVGSLIMQGATEPFRAFLALRPAPYALGAAYSDELTLSSVAAAERPRHPDWDRREPPAIYGVSQAITLSTVNLLEWAPNFIADFAAQALKGAGWILGYPALVAVSRGNPDPGSPLRLDVPLVHWQEPVYALFGQAWMPLLSFVGVLALLVRVAARSGREALALGILLLGLGCYPAIQFSVRHIFYLEFVWVLALLSLPCALWEWRRLMPVLPRFVFATIVTLSAMALAYIGLAQFQQCRLTREFAAVLALPREPVTVEREIEPDGSILLRTRVPSTDAAIVIGPPDSMNDGIAEVGIENNVRAGAERMLLTIRGASCPAGPITLLLRYDRRPHVWQPLDSEMTVRRDDVVIFPALYRATQSFAGVVIPATYAGCEVGLFRLPLTYDLPLVLTAVLPPNWQSLPLRKGLGRFEVTPPQ
jgi:hypothetical protein